MMSTADIHWDELPQLSGDGLKQRVFSILQEAALEVQNQARDEPTLLAAVPRLAELIENRSELAGYRELFSAFARATGLWNYIDKSEADSTDSIAAEVANIAELGIALHREQWTALNILLDGGNLILSAPTSFGKSILVDAILLNRKYKRVAIVLPTIALLDEFRRRLIHRFRERFDILMHHSEKANQRDVIFLGTQERLINRKDLGHLDLVVVDEFYKLDPARKDERSITLNAAVYRLLRNSKQFFFLGPNIENVVLSNDSRWQFQFLKTRFATVAVDTIDLKNIPQKFDRLYREIAKDINWPALVFVSSPDKANKLCIELVKHNLKVGNGEALSVWMKQNYGENWDLSDAVASGVGVHHGRIPRALASRFITLFNKKQLPVLICTSTLIEGVNTAAKSVAIYDKTISRSNYDFFTFSNIRGRAGRLGQHHVGRVFLFHAPPGRQDIEVTAPLFGDLDDAPDEFVVHIDDEDATVEITDRIEDLADRIGLNTSDVQRFSGLGIDVLIHLGEATAEAINRGAPIVWRGRPSCDQILAVCKIICTVRPVRNFGCVSPDQLALYINQLRNSNLMRSFYLWHSNGYRGQSHESDRVFKFLRSMEYNLPEYFGVIEKFVSKSYLRLDYSLFIAEMPRWFRAEVLKVLEEQGVPMQISERFLRNGDNVNTLGQRLKFAATRGSDRLSALEREWVLDALP